MPTIACQVSASNQDCLVYKNILGNWTFSLTHNQVSIGFHDAARYAQGAGLYFPNVPIPPGSTIIQAFLILRASDPKALTPCKAKIEVEYNATPTVFSTLADYQARTKSLIVKPLDYTGSPWSKDKLYASPDIKGHIQVAINHPAWAEGNPIVLFWTDHDEESYAGVAHEREAYSYNSNPSEAPRLEITYEPPTPPAPPPPWPLPVPPGPPRKGWCGTDLQYEYVDTGFKLTFHTDTPCHLWCRMTTTPPRKHALPSMRRGLYIQGDIRFCFVVYEDNEQQEPGDTLIHTFVKDDWPICETRWFYFIGRVYGDLSPSESPIFKFHFPSPPPSPPPPMEREFLPYTDNRSIWYSHGAWATARNTGSGNIATWHGAPTYMVAGGTRLTASYFIYRGYLAFDTSSLPATAKIQGAQLSLFSRSIERTSDITVQDICITRGVFQRPPIASDYGAQNSITDIGGAMKLDNMVLNQYNDIPLNLTGFNFIQPGLDTLLCIRELHDIDDDAPVLGSNVLTFYSQQKGVGYYPLLKVQYYPA